MYRHQCHAPYCMVRTKPQMFACLNHWNKLPADLKTAISENYRVGQCDDKRVSREWLDAAIKARKWWLVNE